MRGFLQNLESLPVCYIREGPIPAEEIRSASIAFEAGHEPVPINPFVARWDDTFQYPGPSAAKDFVNFRLDEIVHMLWREDPSILLQPPRHGKQLRDLFEADRRLPKTARKRLRDNFVKAIGRFLLQWSIPFPVSKTVAFANWIYDDPTRCPGLRLAYETQHAFLANVTDTPLESDIRDLTLVNAIPYTDAATLDRRMLHYSRVAFRKLNSLNPSMLYQDKVFRDLAAVMKTVP
jgi:hypothetical protein